MHHGFPLAAVAVSSSVYLDNEKLPKAVLMANHSIRTFPVVRLTEYVEASQGFPGAPKVFEDAGDSVPPRLAVKAHVVLPFSLLVVVVVRRLTRLSGPTVHHSKDYPGPHVYP